MNIKKLTPEIYNICRKKGTEPAFTGKYWNLKDKGIYKCVCCETELFSSDTKFVSGTGWPSFFSPIKKNSIKESASSSVGSTKPSKESRKVITEESQVANRFKKLAGIISG